MLMLLSAIQIRLIETMMQVSMFPNRMLLIQVPLLRIPTRLARVPTPLVNKNINDNISKFKAPNIANLRMRSLAANSLTVRRMYCHLRLKRSATHS